MVTGLRIDHPDGLYAPGRVLRAGCRTAAPGPGAARAATTSTWSPRRSWRPGERLPEGWATAGTTGYEFLNLVNGIFVDRAQARAMEQVYARAHQRAAAVRRGRRTSASGSSWRPRWPSEINMLAHRLNRISEKHRSSRDFTLRQPHHRAARDHRGLPGLPHVRRATPRAGRDATSDRAATRPRVHRARGRPRQAAHAGHERARSSTGSQDVLTLRVPGVGERGRPRRSALDFVRRFQQITGPVTAKGYEDTVALPLQPARLAQRGGRRSQPLRHLAGRVPRRERRARGAARRTRCRRRPPTTPSAARTCARASTCCRRSPPSGGRGWPPGSGSTASTARWSTARRCPAPTPSTCSTRRWSAPGRSTRDRLPRLPASRPSARPRCTPAGSIPNPRYDEALARFAEAILDPERSAPFLEDFVLFQARVAHFGALNSLGADAREAHRPRRAGLLPGQRAVGPEPRRSRQPPAGGLGRARAACWTSCWRRWPPPPIGPRSPTSW